MLTLTILLTLWPYLFFAGCGLLFSLDGNGGAPLVIFLLVYAIISVVLASLYSSYAVSLALPLKKLGRQNMLVKLIPAICDLVLYALIIASYIETMIDIANGAMMCVPIYLIIFVLLIPYNLSRICMLFSTMRVTRHALSKASLYTDHPIPDSVIRLHTVLHLLPIADVISSILVYRKLNSFICSDANS